VLNKGELEQAHHNNYNFDVPDAFDFDLLIASLKRLKDGKKVEVRAAIATLCYKI
jgi:uridine kinase